MTIKALKLVKTSNLINEIGKFGQKKKKEEKKS
jgi:hypothetical protein